MKYFDPKNPAWHDEPFEGAIEVSDEEHAALYAHPFPYGKALDVVDGKVIFVDAAPRVYTDEELAGIVRAKRDSLIHNHIDKVNAVRWVSLTGTEQTQVSEYRQALLGIPQQPGFPHEVEWPVIPECLT